MEEKIDKAVNILLDQVRTNLKPAEALQQSQALLNMAHARAILLKPEKSETQKTTTRKQGASNS